MWNCNVSSTGGAERCSLARTNVAVYETASSYLRPTSSQLTTSHHAFR
jgi:hypothetical protein